MLTIRSLIHGIRNISIQWRPKRIHRISNLHNMYQVNIKNGKLNLQLLQRSADIFLEYHL